jgi:hypothetical protein
MSFVVELLGIKAVADKESVERCLADVLKGERNEKP